MWRGNPVLTSVIFGLPLGFLSLIVYSICCADIMDADEDEEPGKSKRARYGGFVLFDIKFGTVSDEHEKRE